MAITREDVKAITKAALFTPLSDGRWGATLAYRGKPGTGKTAILSELAHELGMPMLVKIGSIIEPTDLAGIPSLAKFENGPTVMRYAPAEWVVTYGRYPRSILMLDELTTSPASVQNAELRLINEGMVGDYPLPSGMRIVAAMNEIEDVVGGQDLGGAMANRLGHIYWSGPTPSEWSEYMMRSFSHKPVQINSEQLELDTLSVWPSCRGKARSLVVGFIQRRQTLLHQMPSAHTPEAGKAWPSMRSWELASDALASSYAHNLTPDQTDTFMAAYVGDAAIAEFANWRRQSDLPDALDVLDGKAKWEPDVSRLDIVFAVTSSATQAVINEPMDKGDKRRRVIALWGLLGMLAGVAADCAVGQARQLEDAGLTYNEPEVDNALVRLFGPMQAAGVLRVG